jgi:carboxymethylenebutenolidase
MLDQSIINLYDEYTHKPLSRLEFIQRLALLAGGMSAAMSILPLLESAYSHPLSDESVDLFTERVNYPGVNGEMRAYVARPKEDKPYPTIIVIHENRGLTLHIEDVARRVALAGFLAIAPNALAPIGEVKDEDEARTKFAELKAEDNEQNFIRVFDYLKTRKDSNGNYGCVGFCWGGAMSNFLIANVPQLKAAVAFYGRQGKIEQVPQIKGALQLHYAENDERINAGMAAYEDALKANNIVYEQYIYPGVQHAFHNDTSAARYNAEAAQLAWSRTIAFFNKYVK